MDKVGNAEVRAVAEALGYHPESDGLFISDGRSTGPKAIWIGFLDEDEYITPQELWEFLIDQHQLLEDEVEEAFIAVFGARP